MATKPTTEPVTETTEREYTFTAVCRSGEEKTTTFFASSYREARTLLEEFITYN